MQRCRQPITPDPEPEPEFVEVNGLPYTYCFEDGWPWIGDYDMNDPSLDIVHAAGGLCVYDQANLNGLMGITGPGRGV